MTWPRGAQGVSAREASPMSRTRLCTRWLPAMLRLPAFSYLRPGSASEAAQMLHEHGDRARLVAGGTDLLPKMKRGQMEPQVLVGLGHLDELRQVRSTQGGGFDIGASVTLSQVLAHPKLRAA